MSYYFTSKEEVFRNICALYAGCYSFSSIKDVFTGCYEAAEISQDLYELALGYVDEIEDVYELTEARSSDTGNLNNKLIRFFRTPEVCVLQIDESHPRNLSNRFIFKVVGQYVHRPSPIDRGYKANLTNWLSDPRGCYADNGQ